MGENYKMFIENMIEEIQDFISENYLVRYHKKERDVLEILKKDYIKHFL